jgi:hypothetical protein
MDTLANHMGLYLQKTNIIRDYLEDITEEPAPRMFWPKQIWGKYANELADFKEPKNRCAAFANTGFDTIGLLLLTLLLLTLALPSLIVVLLSSLLAAAENYNLRVLQSLLAVTRTLFSSVDIVFAGPSMYCQDPQTTSGSAQ